jgi:hypothetical protein
LIGNLPKTVAVLFQLLLPYQQVHISIDFANEKVDRNANAKNIYPHYLTPFQSTGLCLENWVSMYFYPTERGIIDPDQHPSGNTAARLLFFW